MRTQVKNFKKLAVFSLFFCLMLLIGVFSNQALAAFTEPTAPAPEKNAPEYINIGESNQAKQGALRLGSDNITDPFNYQLEVLGEGAKISEAVAEQNLKVLDVKNNDKDTLFVDADNNKVCVGPCLGVSASKLEVSGGSMLINAGNNIGLYAVSNDNEAIYGEGENYGIQGLTTGTNNAGVMAVNTLGIAAEGFNTGNNYSDVAGFSDTGYGVYGTNLNTLGLWSGYFSGRLESNDDVSAAKFLPTKLQNSLVPFTSGQVAGSYNFNNPNLAVKLFDGTYLWAVDSTKLYKIRASDGFKVFELPVGNNPASVIFDGNNIWVTVAGADKIVKINPYSSATICTLSSVESPQGIVFDGQYYWVTAENENGEGIIVKMNSVCGQVGSSKVVTANNYALGKIIYDGGYLWALATSGSVGKLIKVNPSNLTAVGIDNLVGINPMDIFFDNYFYWVASQSGNQLTKFYWSDKSVNKVCSNNLEQFCNSDDICSGGVCSGPVAFDAYATGNNPTYLAFDGTYIWATTAAGLSRILAADADIKADFSLGFAPTGLVFDGTYLWVSSGSGLTKIYSGRGWGATDLSGTLTLQFNSPLIQQNGSININGSARIGADLTSQGNLSADNNVWGDETAGDVISGIYSDTWQSNLTSGNTITDLLEASDGSIYASAFPANVYKSTDGGITWNPTGALAGATSAVSLLQASDGSLYAGTEANGDVFRSTNGGTTWNNTGNLNNGVDNADVVDDLLEASDGAIYAAVGHSGFSGGEVYKTTDNGASWTSTGSLPGANVAQVLMEDSEGALYVGTIFNGDVFRSDDGGTSWNNTADLPSAEYPRAIIQATDGSIFVAANLSGAASLYRTTSQGDSWEKLPDVAVTTDVSTLIQASDGALYLGGRDDEVYKSTNGGVTWTSAGVLTGAILVSKLIQIQDGSFLAGTLPNGGVFKLALLPLLADTYSCPAGHFIKNIQTNSSGQTTKIECRPL